MEKNLERWVIEAATSEFLDRIADFPFEGVLSAFEEVIQLLFDIDLVATTFEEQIVKRFSDVLLRRSPRDVSRPAQMWHRHFFLINDGGNVRKCLSLSLSRFLGKTLASLFTFQARVESTWKKMKMDYGLFNGLNDQFLLGPFNYKFRAL